MGWVVFAKAKGELGVVTREHGCLQLQNEAEKRLCHTVGALCAQGSLHLTEQSGRNWHFCLEAALKQLVLCSMCFIGGRWRAVHG